MATTPAQVADNPPRPPMAPLGLPIRPRRINHPAQVLDGPPQLGQVQPPRRLHQHRVGHQLHLLGQALGAVGDTRA
jgi:hypothetical protein